MINSTRLTAVLIGIHLKIEAGGGHVRLFYNDVQKLDWTVTRRGCYFKAGCYTQSNVEKGDSPDDYGEVLIRQIQIQPVAP